MKCQLCSNEGSIFFTQFENNKLQQFCYCQKCAEKKGILDAGTLSLSSLMNEVALQQISENVEVDHDSFTSLFECPVCHFTLDDWKRTQRLGCSRCYEVFHPDLIQRLEQVQDDTTHTGKQPTQKQIRQTRLTQKRQLQKMLDTALSQEDYEQAARIRDQLSTL